MHRLPTAVVSLVEHRLLSAQAPERTGSITVVHWLSCPTACGIFPDQGSDPCSLHWQADSQPLGHQGSPRTPTSDVPSQTSGPQALALHPRQRNPTALGNLRMMVILVSAFQDKQESSWSVIPTRQPDLRCLPHTIQVVTPMSFTQTNTAMPSVITLN